MKLHSAASPNSFVFCKPMIRFEILFGARFKNIPICYGFGIFQFIPVLYLLDMTG
jgi:hypothetical protein